VTNVRRIELGKNLLSENDRVAQSLREQYDAAGVRVINLMSSPGAGKTSLLERTAEALHGRVNMTVIEGDLATDRDARRLRALGIATHQINTGRGCHLSARMVAEALESFPLRGCELLFIENVGNLVCPAAFSLGEHKRVVTASVPEGDDKPVKYPVAFRTADCVVLNKIDLLDNTDFSPDRFHKWMSQIQPAAVVFEVSCRTGQGLDAWFEWLYEVVSVKAQPAAPKRTQC